MMKAQLLLCSFLHWTPGARRGAWAFQPAGTRPPTRDGGRDGGRDGASSKREYRRLEDHEAAPPVVATTVREWPPPSFRWDAPRTEVPVVADVDELRSAVLDDGLELNQIEITGFPMEEEAQQPSSSILSHEVLDLLSRRFKENSKPGARNDDGRLALAIEGGGMRGAVSAGMAAAIAALGLADAFDDVYGSSAGSVIGAYLVSRQMCVDVYVDVLPAAKGTFVCKKRLVRSIATDAYNVAVASVRGDGTTAAGGSDARPTTTTDAGAPGMNTTFVLDGIMGEDRGVRPLDVAKFMENNEKQQLRIVASCVDPDDGSLRSTCFGTEDFHGGAAARRVDGTRDGLFACLQGSITVPGATGPPVELATRDCPGGLPCFDAFCFEPIPYRSAVEEGATHVMALCSRPADFTPKTKPGVYDKGVAPIYFRSHGLERVAEFFERGGQQYLYAEDLLLLERAKSREVKVPPPRVLYGTRDAPRIREAIERRDEWASAHLLPVKVPPGTPELASLEQDEDAVLDAVRGGFAAAFDLLAPVVGMGGAAGDVGGGAEAARLVFPDRSAEAARRALRTRLEVPGDSIAEASSEPPAREGGGGFRTRLREALRGRRRRRDRLREKRKRAMRTTRHVPGGTERNAPGGSRLDASEKLRNSPVSSAVDGGDDKARSLLTHLPGFQNGRFGHLAKDLKGVRK